jgi:inner membrane protein
VGAALGEAGLKRRTRFGNAALMIAANLPDLDVLVFATDIPSVSFRRGWTHGIAAQVLLPILFTGALVAVDRLRPARDGTPRVHAGWLLLLSYVGIYSHVFLDLLNNYGVRLLTPVDWRWFYGDAVFIVDPWLWLSLGAGVWLARRWHAVKPARTALLVAACYVAAMIVSARAARTEVIAAWREAHGSEPRAVMVGPRPLTPFSRDVIIDAGEHYETGLFTWWPRRVTFDPVVVPKNEQQPEVAAARHASAVRHFLVWSRFPFWEVAPEAGGSRVSVRDMRFMATGARFGASVVVGSAD